MSRDWKWSERASAWDDFVDRELRRRKIDEMEQMNKRHAQQLELTTLVLTHAISELAIVLQDQSQLARLANIDDPTVPRALLLTAPNVLKLHKMSLDAAATLPRLQEAERLARGIRIKEKNEQTDDGFTVFRVAVDQPPRQETAPDLTELLSQVSAPVPELDGDTAEDDESEDAPRAGFAIRF